MTAYQDYREAAASISERSSLSPEIGIITGTGLSLSDLMSDEEVSIPYHDIPHFPKPTAPSHQGQVRIGRVDKVPVAIFQGRFHVYEGLSLDKVTFPVRVLQQMGVSTVILLNAAGSVSRKFLAGDLALLSDHINFMQENPLIGPNDEGLGPRFPDMSVVYDQNLRKRCIQAAQALEMPLQEGVYLALKGPSLETSAEYKMISRLGADLVGMSTVPEAIVARHAGLRVLGISVVSNDIDFSKDLEPTTIEEVVDTVQSAEGRICALLNKVLQAWE